MSYQTNLLRSLLTRSKDDDKDCDCQPTWLSLALAILPAVLPVLIDKLGNLLMRWLFDDEEEDVLEDDDPKPSKKAKKSR